MTTVNCAPDNADGSVGFYNGTYAQSREGASGSDLVGGTIPFVGQIEDFNGPGDPLVGQAFLAFDTSVIPDGAIVFSVLLRIYGQTGGGVPNSPFLVEARLHDWGAAVTSADFVPGSSLGSKTLLATYDVAVPGGWNTAGYMDFVSEAAFAGNINKTGTTRLVLASANQRLDAPPTGRELGEFFSATEAQPPILTVEYSLSETGGDTGAEGIGLAKLVQKRKPLPKSNAFRVMFDPDSDTGLGVGIEGVGVRQGFFQKRRPVKSWPHVEDPQLGGMTTIERPIIAGSARFGTSRPSPGSARLVP